MSSYLFANARIVDGTAPEPGDPTSVLVEDGVIREVSASVKAGGAEVVDLKGRTLMPGLIDCHVHVVASLANLGENARLPDSLAAPRAAIIMRDMLARGFTTVRDVGGADIGLKRAVGEGLFPAPRLFICGKALSQTGGHADFRGPFDDTPVPTNRFRLGALGRVCDGVDGIRRAAREEIKNGAEFIKIMANGGAASPTDPIHFLGFSRDELLAVVEEAQNAGTYVSAHVYTDDGIRRVVECGVHSLEHCNFISSETAALAREKGAYAVPTLVTYEKLVSEGGSLGFPADSVAKADYVRSGGMKSLETMRDAGLAMAYGTDLLGDMHRHQSEEFVIRGRVLPAQEVIASATSVAARLVRMEGKLGTIAADAFADLIVVDGNPLEDLSLLTGQGKHMPVIMQAGRFVKRTALG
ncbi:metal-dependent hydrolase family protein [Nitratireductor soli]|uniref:metal-dependent hydrolase family protein n=1 Tax=Nitratireductor soli TaxID=1670619 RepID=UPI00065E2C67|nr:amidohydrolase family protein [Nitratireductor soli]